MLVAGKLHPQDITLSVSASNLSLPPELEACISKVWDEKVAEATEEVKTIFNGTSYRLNEWSYKNETLHLDLAVFDFKHRSALIELIKRAEIDEDVFPQGGCFTGASVRTSDGKFVVVELSGKSMNTNTYELLGGMVETDVSMTIDGTFLFNTLYKELFEEADITTDEITDCYLRMFYRGVLAHTGFYFEVTTKLTEPELTERSQTNSDTDIARLHFFTKEEYSAFLRSQRPNKQLIATLISED